MRTPDRHTLQDLAWEDLMVLLVAVDVRSLSGAARVLRIGQSTASRRLARLENVLGARLFDRTPEGLAPTALALTLVPHARLIEGHMADILRIAAGQEATPSGRVQLAVPDGLASELLLPRLPAFHARYPDVQLDFTIGPAVLDLVRGEADIALRFVPSTSADLIEVPLGTMTLAPYAVPELADRPLKDLRWVMLLDPNRAFQETRWIDTHVAPTHRMTVSLWNAMLAAARSGVGAAILPQLVAEPAGLVRLRPDLPAPEGRPLRLVFHRALRQVPRIRVVVDWLREQTRVFLSDSELTAPGS